MVQTVTRAFIRLMSLSDMYVHQLNVFYNQEMDIAAEDGEFHHGSRKNETFASNTRNQIDSREQSVLLANMS